MGRSSLVKDSVGANRDTTINTSGARILMIKRVQTLEEQPRLRAGGTWCNGKGPSCPFPLQNLDLKIGLHAEIDLVCSFDGIYPQGSHFRKIGAA